MPGGLFEADTSFPDLSTKKTTEEKLKAVQDYLYMLLETLRWTLRNLEPGNFNDADMAPYIGDQVINNFTFNQQFQEEFETIIADTVITNTLITNELYSEYGEIADLVVDELRTDYKRVLYYNSTPKVYDTLDYIHIHDEEIEFITESVKYVGGVAQTEQFHHGDRYFWWYDQAHTQITSTHNTGDPVIVFQYDKLVKGHIHFEEVNGTKIPTIVLGAGVGDPSDPDKGKGFIRKNTDSFDMWLEGTQDNGIFIGTYTDIVGLRKTTAIDFSNWDNGSFSETVDGSITAQYAVTFDANDRPVKITDGAGHETVVTW